MNCRTCAEYIYKGKKFNARKETVENEDYYGIKIFRFYIKCTRCSAEITFKTDPKNTDYIAEHGAARNFEPWRDTSGKEEVDKLALLEQEEDDPMKALENRTVDSKREMDILDKLQEIRGRNARLERADADTVLERISSRRDPAEMDEEERQAELDRFTAEEEDEELVRRYFAKGIVPPPEIELDGEEAQGTDDNISGQNSDMPYDNDETTPRPGPSNTTLGLASNEHLAKPADGPSIKRKVVDIEPDAHSLLSDEARKIADSVSFRAPPLPKKKQKIGGSSLLGIKPKVKGKT